MNWDIFHVMKDKDPQPKSWQTIQVLDQNSVHVIPLDDTIMHSTSEDCGCNPFVEPVKRDDGVINWIVAHHAQDGRE